MKSTVHNPLVKVAMVAFAIPLLASCSLVSPVQMDTQKEVLNQLPHTVPQRPPHAATLLVLPPQTNPTYDTPQMAYVVRPYQVDFFTQHEWSATPGQMLLPLLITTLERTHNFSEVLSPPYPSDYTYSLRTEIQEVSQDFTSNPAAAKLSLRLQLNDGATGRVIATRKIEVREPIPQKTPYAGVVATNNATAKALEEAAQFVLDNVK